MSHLVYYSAGSCLSLHFLGNLPTKFSMIPSTLPAWRCPVVTRQAWGQGASVWFAKKSPPRNQLLSTDRPHQQATVEIGLVCHPPQGVFIHREHRIRRCSPFPRAHNPPSSANTDTSRRTAFLGVTSFPSISGALLLPGTGKKPFIGAVFYAGGVEINAWAAVSHRLLSASIDPSRVYPGYCCSRRRRRWGQPAEI